MEITGFYSDDDQIQFLSKEKFRHGQKVQYKTTIFKHGNHISIHKQMFVNGALNGHSELVHVPNSIIKDILKLTSKKMKEKIISLIRAGEKNNIDLAEALANGQGLTDQVLAHFAGIFEILKYKCFHIYDVLSFDVVRKIVNLKNLNCPNNNITELDLSNNPNLTSLHCYNNNLSKLDLSNNAALEFLYCHDNNITELDLSNNAALQFLSCHDNNITELDLSNNVNLKILDCENNPKLHTVYLPRGWKGIIHKDDHTKVV